MDGHAIFHIPSFSNPSPLLSIRPYTYQLFFSTPPSPNIIIINIAALRAVYNEHQTSLVQYQCNAFKCFVRYYSILQSFSIWYFPYRFGHNNIFIVNIQSKHWAVCIAMFVSMCVCVFAMTMIHHRNISKFLMSVCVWMKYFEVNLFIARKTFQEIYSIWIETKISLSGGVLVFYRYFQNYFGSDWKYLGRKNKWILGNINHTHRHTHTKMDSGLKIVSYTLFQSKNDWCGLAVMILPRHCYHQPLDPGCILPVLAEIHCF